MLASLYNIAVTRYTPLRSEHEKRMVESSTNAPSQGEGSNSKHIPLKILLLLAFLSGILHSCMV
jgi:hypothetical protein